MMRRNFQRVGLALAALLPALAPCALGQLNRPIKELEGVDVAERLGETADLGVILTDADGNVGTLGQHITGGKPVILVLGYYDCPLVCPLVLDKLLERLNAIDYTIGQDYNVVVVSFDPTNTTEMARGYRDTYLGSYRVGKQTPGLAEGWTFHTAAEDQSQALSGSVGFKYRYLPESGEYAHPVSLVVLTPEGKVARYIYGFAYTAQDVKLALLEASEGKIAKGVLDRVLLWCFHYDPARGGYSMAAFRVMQLGAGATAVGVGVLLGGLWFYDKRRTRRAGARTITGAAATPAALAWSGQNA